MSHNLTVFFSFGISVKTWDKWGQIGREKLIYERLLERGYIEHVNWVTYDSDDVAVVQKLKDSGQMHARINVLTPPAILSNTPGWYLYSVLAPVIHWRTMRKTSVIKTDQSSGAWTAVLARILFAKPFVYRSGYIWSYNKGKYGEKAKSIFARFTERLALRFSHASMVTSAKARDYYKSLVPSSDPVLVPINVDTSLFHPIKNYDPKLPFLFVGRLEEVKKIDNLIRACAKIGHPLHIYGRGSLQPELEALAKELGADVVFKGVVPNKELAGIHHNYSIYVLCSMLEGMPRTMVEAMASGLICVGTDVSGIQELIEDGINGFLAPDTNADSIQAALERALDAMDGEVGRKGRELVGKRNSLDNTTRVEEEIIEMAIAKSGARTREFAG